MNLSQVYDTWQSSWHWLEGQGLGAFRWILLGVILTFIWLRILVPLIYWRAKTGQQFFSDESRKRIQTVGAILRGTGSVLIWLGMVTLLLRDLGVSLGTILASAGIFGLSVSLGAQGLFKDMFAGIFILLENHYNIGDVVDIAGVSGKVEEINLRTTILRDLKGAMHIIPNGNITIVTNRTKEWAQVVLDTPISQKADIDHAIKVITEVSLELMKNKGFQEAVLSPPRVLGVNEVTATQVTIRALVKTAPNKQWAVERLLQKKVKQALDKAGIV